MKPALLIASPQLKDPHFARAVVLLWHHDEEGAIGVVVNRPLDRTLPDVLELPGDIDLSWYADTHVTWGGPVEMGSGTVVTPQAVPDDEGWNVDGIGVSRSMDVLVSLLEAREPLLLCLGYAGWGPGQLDDELQAGGWLWTDLDPKLVFETPHDQKYDRALATLGLTAAMVWMSPVSE
ncbi:MAG: YqgE/AlgH family protein [Alphaproteobacteria bacterium]|nr:YqgE/AlgH family protein [Alphaproteobacteria bacterium]